MKGKPKFLYTVYRNKGDELLAFEQPAYKCAELMGIQEAHFRHIACYADKFGYTVIKTLANGTQC